MWFPKREKLSSINLSYQTDNRQNKDADNRQEKYSRNLYQSQEKLWQTLKRRNIPTRHLEAINFFIK